jgi:2-oxoglutarate ferredoxin oxidoreductase subunit alpha
MAALETLTKLEVPLDLQPVVNDFSITVGTINGSGSQTSNLTLLRALFKMGIPVSGKNIFPSNIQGLPVWYNIRVSKDGFLARREQQEIVVAMNPNTFSEDLRNVVPGGAFFYGDHIKQAIDREDIAIYPIPAKKLARESDAPAKLRDYVANMAYVGVLAHILGIDLDMIQMALDFHFKGKQKPIALNMSVLEAAVIWAEENLEKNDPFFVEPMDGTADYILTDGNTAAALGSIYGGVHFASWYPITPASSLAESLTSYLPRLRVDPDTGRNTYAVVQAEDELAAIGMAIGAGWGGLRAVTSTSGPGLSLMTEFAGLAYFAEIPVVIWDVQRVGPSTGLPTRTQQGDILMVRFLGHGDTENIILFPGSATECFELGWKAFDIADSLQAPIFVLSDLDLGMNQWMTKPFEYPDAPIDRGKVLWENELEAWEGPWGRYMDVDGDGIPYRTVPGNRHPLSAYFSRGTGHDEFARYTEDREAWLKNAARIKKKYETGRAYLPKPIVSQSEGAEICILAVGSVDPAIQEACQSLAEAGIPVDYMRVRAIPFDESVRNFVEEHARTYVVEINRDGQLHKLLTLEVPDLATRLVSLSHSDGLPLTAAWIIAAIQAKEE